MTVIDAKLRMEAVAYPMSAEAPDCAVHEPVDAWSRPMRFDAHAQAWSNGRMLCIFSRPADLDPWLFRRTRTLHPDPGGPDRPIGAALRAALGHSRHWAQLLLQEPLPEINRRERRIRHLRWLLALMERHGYRTMHNFLIRMQCCLIHQGADGIVIVPTRHQRIQAWSCLPRESVITLPAGSGNAALGAALRQAFSRCIGELGPRADGG
jgi:hypothetical protein